MKFPLYFFYYQIDYSFIAPLSGLCFFYTKIILYNSYGINEIDLNILFIFESQNFGRSGSFVFYQT